MSSVMRGRRDVVGDSVARWNMLQVAHPCFRLGVLRGRLRPSGRQTRQRAGLLRSTGRARYMNTAKRLSPIALIARCAGLRLDSGISTDRRGVKRSDTRYRTFNPQAVRLFGLL